MPHLLVTWSSTVRLGQPEGKTPSGKCSRSVLTNFHVSTLLQSGYYSWEVCSRRAVVRAGRQPLHERNAMTFSSPVPAATSAVSSSMPCSTAASPAADVVATARNARGDRRPRRPRRRRCAAPTTTTRRRSRTRSPASTGLLLVSSSEVGQRVAQHPNVIDAAAAAGVGLLAYTSIAHADTSDLAARGRAPGDRGAARRVRAAARAPAQQLVPRELHRAARDRPRARCRPRRCGRRPGQRRHPRRLRRRRGRRARRRRPRRAGLRARRRRGVHPRRAMPPRSGGSTGRDDRYTRPPDRRLRGRARRAGLPEGYAAVLADSDRGLRGGALLTETGDLSRLIGGRRPASRTPSAPPSFSPPRQP